MAFRHPLVGAPGVGFHGGPVIEDPAWQDLRHTRYFRPVDRFGGHAAVSETLAGDYAYLGPIYPHFGHFMSEMVHRLLAATTELAWRKLLLLSTIDDTQCSAFTRFPAFCQDVYRLFSIDPDRLVVLTQDRVVEQLHVVQQGSDFGGGPRPGYLDRLAAFSDRALGQNPSALPKFSKVYVSRSALPGGGGFLGERYLEHLLAEQGFHIARPETMPLFDQMHLYRHADLIVFPEGSACHGVELLGSGSLGTVVFVGRRADHREIFRRILAPRARRYIAIDPSPGTGTILGNMQHITVGVVDIAALAATLRDLDACRDLHVDVDTYVETSEQDFAAHVAHFKASGGAVVDDALLHDRATSLAATFRRLRETGAS